MHILTTNINGDPNVGLYGYCNDHYCLLGSSVSDNTAKEIKKVLGVPVHKLNLCGTSMVGLFCTGNNSKIVIPGIVFDSELEKLNKLGIDFEVIETKLTALGNNLLCNDSGVLANPEFSADVKKRIRQALGVPLKPGKIAELDIVGSLGVLNSKGCLIHRDATPKEIKYIESLLNIKCGTGTISMGSPFVRSGILCNSNGMVVSDISWGPELGNADEALGFLDGGE